MNNGTSRVARALRLLLLGVGAGLMLAGPTPGAVGSCGEDDPPVNLPEYCKTREELICERRRLRNEFATNRLEEPQYVTCRTMSVGLCMRRFWAPECRPTERQATACLNALQSYDTLRIPDDEVPECAAHRLCRARPQAPGDAGTGSAQVDGGGAGS